MMLKEMTQRQIEKLFEEYQRSMDDDGEDDVKLSTYVYMQWTPKCQEALIY